MDRTLDHPLSVLDEAQLLRMAKVADRMLAGRPRIMPGNRPHLSRAGQGVEFLDHREYLPGDSLRDIDWRISAKSHRLQVRRYRNETSADWFICLDRSASMSLGDGRKWSLALQLSAALAYLLLHLDNRVALILFSDRIDGLKPLGRGKPAYASLLRFLEPASPKEYGGDSLLKCCVSRIPFGSQILIVSDFLHERGMNSDLSLLAKIGEEIHAIQVLDRTDGVVTETGHVTLSDVESGKQVNLNLTKEAQARVSQRFMVLIEALESHCHSSKINFSSCTTTETWRDVLLRHVMNLGAFRA